jgi:phage terminase small subunit
MNIDPDQLPPPPADPRHHLFAVLVSKGRYLAEAYQEAGFQCSRATAYVNGHRLSRKPAVADYIDALIRAACKAREEARRKEWEATAAYQFQVMRAKVMR